MLSINIKNNWYFWITKCGPTWNPTFLSSNQQSKIWILITTKAGWNYYVIGTGRKDAKCVCVYEYSNVMANSAPQWWVPQMSWLNDHYGDRVNVCVCLCVWGRERKRVNVHQMIDWLLATISTNNISINTLLENTHRWTVWSPVHHLHLLPSVFMRSALFVGQHFHTAVPAPPTCIHFPCVCLMFSTATEWISTKLGGKMRNGPRRK